MNKLPIGQQTLDKKPKKDKWYGNCNICKQETKLATVHVSLGIGITFWISRSCDDCIYIIKESVWDSVNTIAKLHK